MPRPRLCLCRNIKFNFNSIYFKPQGIPLTKLKVNELSMEEIEAYRLKDVLGLEQTAAAYKMNVSQSTYQRILTSAHKKVADALVNGKAIKIVKHSL